MTSRGKYPIAGSLLGDERKRHCWTTKSGIAAGENAANPQTTWEPASDVSQTKEKTKISSDVENYVPAEAVSAITTQSWDAQPSLPAAET